VTRNIDPTEATQLALHSAIEHNARMAAALRRLCFAFHQTHADSHLVGDRWTACGHPECKRAVAALAGGQPPTSVPA